MNSATPPAAPGVVSPDRLHEVLAAELKDSVWLDTAFETINRQPSAIARLFPAAGRQCGRWTLTQLPGWTVDDAARVLLLTRLPAEALATELEPLYRFGDGAEKRAVLRALPLLVVESSQAEPLLLDALRTNDTRLVAAALGPAGRQLNAAAWRQGVLKAVFMGLPLADVADLKVRADRELATMLAGLVEERRAAGRTMAADATDLLQYLQERVS